MCLRTSAWVWPCGAVLLLLARPGPGAAAWVESTFHASQRAEKRRRCSTLLPVPVRPMNRSLLGWDVLLASAAEQLAEPPPRLASRCPGCQPLAGPGGAAACAGALPGHRRCPGARCWRRRTAGRAVAGATAARVFAAVLQQPIPALLFSTAQVSATNFEPSFYVARPLRGTQARWLAVVQVQAALLTPVLMQSVDIAGLHVSLVRDDGAALLSVPAQSSPGLLPTPLQAEHIGGRSWPRKRAHPWARVH